MNHLARLSLLVVAFVWIAGCGTDAVQIEREVIDAAEWEAGPVGDAPVLLPDVSNDQWWPYDSYSIDQVGDSVADVEAGEVGFEIAGPEPGTFGWPCEENADCLSS